jgi:hypothetical protein
MAERMFVRIARGSDDVNEGERRYNATALDAVVAELVDAQG